MLHKIFLWQHESTLLSHHPIVFRGERNGLQEVYSFPPLCCYVML